MAMPRRSRTASCPTRWCRSVFSGLCCIVLKPFDPGSPGGAAGMSGLPSSGTHPAAVAGAHGAVHHQHRFPPTAAVTPADVLVIQLEQGALMPLAGRFQEQLRRDFPGFARLDLLVRQRHRHGLQRLHQLLVEQPSQPLAQRRHRVEVRLRNLISPLPDSTNTVTIVVSDSNRPRSARRKALSRRGSPNFSSLYCK